MSSQPNSIFGLPIATRLAISASNQFGDVSQIAQELVLNGVAAAASVVDVVVNAEMRRVDVSDNGSGFPDTILPVRDRACFRNSILTPFPAR